MESFVKYVLRGKGRKYDVFLLKQRCRRKNANIIKYTALKYRTEVTFSFVSCKMFPNMHIPPLSIEMMHSTMQCDWDKYDCLL